VGRNGRETRRGIQRNDYSVSGARRIFKYVEVLDPVEDVEYREV
jgi:hypothetical protein